MIQFPLAAPSTDFNEGGYIITFDPSTFNLLEMLISADNYSSFAFPYLFVADGSAGKWQILEVSHVLNSTQLVTKTPFLWDQDTADVYFICSSTVSTSLFNSPYGAELSKPIKKAIVKATDPSPGSDLTIVTNGNIQQSIGLIYDFPYIIENPGGIVPFAISDASNFNLITQF